VEKDPNVSLRFGILQDLLHGFLEVVVNLLAIELLTDTLLDTNCSTPVTNDDRDSLEIRHVGQGTNEVCNVGVDASGLIPTVRDCYILDLR